MLPDSKEAKLGKSNQEAFPTAGKNTGIVLVPCHTWKCIPTAITINNLLCCYTQFLILFHLP